MTTNMAAIPPLTVPTSIFDAFFDEGRGKRAWVARMEEHAVVVRWDHYGEVRECIYRVTAAGWVKAGGEQVTYGGTGRGATMTSSPDALLDDMAAEYRSRGYRVAVVDYALLAGG